MPSEGTGGKAAQARACAVALQVQRNRSAQMRGLRQARLNAEAKQIAAPKKPSRAPAH
jgi:hypothetical protein